MIERIFKALSVAGVCGVLAACSTTGAQQAASDQVYDPFEKVNRKIFAFNDTLDQAIMKPVAKGYKAVVPTPAREGVHNFLTNLRTPLDFANNVLQGDFKGATTTLTRAAINTTVGVGGLFDVAGDEGIEYQYEDFGQTLAVWGVGNGPYLVIPFMGPSTARDATGLLVDSFADPLRIYLFNIDEEGWQYARVGMTALDTRTALLGTLDDLRRNSYDYYAAMRSSYYQYRAALIRDHSTENSYAPSIPDYDDE